MNNFKTWWEKRNFYGKYAAQQSWDASRKATLDEVRMLVEMHRKIVHEVSAKDLLHDILTAFDDYGQLDKLEANDDNT